MCLKDIVNYYFVIVLQGPLLFSLASLTNDGSNNHIGNSLPEPIGKGRTGSISNIMTPDAGYASMALSKAPGSEREQEHVSIHTLFVFVQIIYQIKSILLKIFSNNYP